jgi:uncharacterized protein YraI
MSLSRSLATGVAAVAAILFVSQAADAAVTHTTANLNLRAGPGTHNRIIRTIPAGSLVDIHSCGTRWCYLSWGPHTGFSDGNFLRSHVTIAVSPLNHVLR